jgi:5-deoxy-glucuronate isomerase
VDGAAFREVGRRKDIWSGNADSVYAGAGSVVQVRAAQDGTEIAVAGGICDKAYPPFRVLPAEVDMVDVGSIETRSHRRIFHILGKNAAGRAGNLLISELYCDHGCWSGYPPHKHNEDRGSAETDHEETYHYRFRPETGFGAQLCFQPDGSSQCFMTRHGDTFLLDRGYHPTVTSPGHEEYIFTILVGKSQRGLVQHFKEDYHYLMAGIPGIQDMVNKFK